VNTASDVSHIEADPELTPADGAAMRSLRTSRAGVVVTDH
jgi:hypothetical protein